MRSRRGGIVSALHYRVSSRDAHHKHGFGTADRTILNEQNSARCDVSGRCDLTVFWVELVAVEKLVNVIDVCAKLGNKAPSKSANEKTSDLRVVFMFG